MSNYVIYKDNGTVMKMYFNATTGWTNSLWNATKYDERSIADHVANKQQESCEFRLHVTEEFPEDRVCTEKS